MVFLPPCPVPFLVFQTPPLCRRLHAGAGHTVSTERGPREGNGLANVHVNRKCHMLQQGSIPEGSMEEVTFKLGLGSCKYSKLELAWGRGAEAGVALAGRGRDWAGLILHAEVLVPRPSLR